MSHPPPPGPPHPHKRKVPPSRVESDMDSPTPTMPAAAPHLDRTVTKRQRERLTPINYFDLLPKDVLSHLFFYLKLLDDEEMYSLGKTSRSMLTFIQSRYERTKKISWYFYRLIDVDANGLKLPWATDDVRSRYVLRGCCDSTESAAAVPRVRIQHEWVILRHSLDKPLLLGLKSLPFESLVLNDYEVSRFSIGQITHLDLKQILPPQPSFDEDTNGGFLIVPHLHFLPHATLKQLEMQDVLFLSPEVLPRRLENLKLIGVLPEVFGPKMITRWPASLHKLSLERSYTGGDSPPTDICLPRSVLRLHLAHGFYGSDLTKIQLPLDLIELSCNPIEPILDWKLPASLQTIHFGRWFNCSVFEWNLPLQLLELTFGQAFNRPLTGMVFNETLPLTHLNLGGFNRPLCGKTLPASLLHLEFGYEFQQTLLGVGLPTGLKTLIYGRWIDSNLLPPRFPLPPSLTHLRLGLRQPPQDAVVRGDEDVAATESAPLVVPSTSMNRLLPLSTNLRYLQIPHCLLEYTPHLPITIEELVIQSECTTSTDEDNSAAAKVNQSNITQLNETFAEMPVLRDLSLDLFNIPIDGLTLSPSLEQLKFTRPFLGSISKALLWKSSSLKRIEFDGDFDQSLDGARFPDTLEFIRFNFTFNQPIDKVTFPHSLREIHFGSSFNQPLDHVIFPHGLEILSLNAARHFNQSLVQCKLPTALKTIQLSSHYDCTVSGLIVPGGLETFEMGYTDEESDFHPIDSFEHLLFPSTLRLIRLPNPHQSSYLEHTSSRAVYSNWLTRLSRQHPYALIEFSRSSGMCGQYCEWSDEADVDPDLDGSEEATDEEDEEEQDEDGSSMSDAIQLVNGPETSPPSPLPPAAHIPAPPLVGVELNPGPVASTSPMPVNYLISLPDDLLNHLFVYSHLFTDADIYSSAKSCQTILRLIGTRYERMGMNQWFIYRLGEIEANGLKIPFTTNEQRDRYVLECLSTSSGMPLTTPSLSLDSLQSRMMNEWVILWHELARTRAFGWRTLPRSSFLASKYQPSPWTIGRITALKLVAPKPPHQSLDMEVPYYLDAREFTPPYLPHLRFLPNKTLTSLSLNNLLIPTINDTCIYELPENLSSLEMDNFSPSIFNRSMLSHWPTALTQLNLPSQTTYQFLVPNQLYFPDSLLRLNLDEHVFTDPSTSLQLPSNLTSLRLIPYGPLSSHTLPDSLLTLELECSRVPMYSVDGWTIPSQLCELRFGPNLSLSLDHIVLNHSLTSLTLNATSERCLTGVTLPDSLTYLDLGVGFHETILGMHLPTGLTTLLYGDWVDECILQSEFSFPPTLTHLRMGGECAAHRDNYQPTPFPLPSNLRTLQIPLYLLLLTELPPTLTDLTIDTESPLDERAAVCSYGDWITALNEIFSSTTKLRHLNLTLTVTPSMSGLRLPDSIEQLSLNYHSDFTQVDIGFGSHLKRLLLDVFYSVSVPVQVQVPNSLIEIEFGEQFDQSLAGFNFLHHLRIITFPIDGRFNQPIIDDELPDSLKFLQLPKNYSCSLSAISVPSQLEIFRFGATNTCPSSPHFESLTQQQFPPTMKQFCLPNPYDAFYSYHPYLTKYRAWIVQLQRQHPYAQFQFTIAHAKVIRDGLTIPTHVEEEKKEDGAQLQVVKHSSSQLTTSPSTPPAAAPVPAARLVGIELNPGPFSSTNPTPVNYLISLPNDLLNHLFFYSHLLSEPDMYALAKTSQTTFSLISSRYECTNRCHWYLYRLIHIESIGLNLPWSTNEERNRYVIECPYTTPVAPASAVSSLMGGVKSCLRNVFSWFFRPASHLHQTHSNEWIILWQPLENVLEQGWTELPSHSFLLTEYQSTRFMIGCITSLQLSVPTPPLPAVTTLLSDGSALLDASPLNLPHLHFLPHKTLTSLSLSSVLINSQTIVSKSYF